MNYLPSTSLGKKYLRYIQLRRIRCADRRKRNPFDDSNIIQRRKNVHKTASIAQRLEHWSCKPVVVMGSISS